MTLKDLQSLLLDAYEQYYLEEIATENDTEFDKDVWIDKHAPSMENIINSLK